MPSNGTVLMVQTTLQTSSPSRENRQIQSGEELTTLSQFQKSRFDRTGTAIGADPSALTSGHAQLPATCTVQYATFGCHDLAIVVVVSFMLSALRVVDYY